MTQQRPWRGRGQEREGPAEGKARRGRGQEREGPAEGGAIGEGGTIGARVQGGTKVCVCVGGGWGGSTGFELEGGVCGKRGVEEAFPVYLYGRRNLVTLERSSLMKERGNISLDSCAVYLK